MIIAAHVAEYFVSPPGRYPDIHVVVNVMISFLGFMWLYVLLTLRLVRAASKKPITSPATATLPAAPKATKNKAAVPPPASKKPEGKQKAKRTKTD